MKRKRMNKKGVIGLILFFLVLFTILIVGFIAAMVIGVLDFTSDTITPVMTDLGMFGDTNMSQAAEYTFGKVDIVIQAAPLILAFSYVAALLFTIVFVISYSFSPHPVYIGFYFMLMILLIFGSIIMSNMYQDIYSSSDEIATRLQEQTIMSYLILYSPWIMSLIAIIAGVLLFSKVPLGGGFEV